MLSFDMDCGEKVEPKTRNEYIPLASQNQWVSPIEKRVLEKRTETCESGSFKKPPMFLRETLCVGQAEFPRKPFNPIR